VLENAEVVVYDALAGEGILNMIPDTAEVINVGKRSSNHTMVQEKINELLVEKAKEGKRVVRLKGGDPFLFGRGGEEIELLVQEGIPYEVVPGITSAISVPAYQGIPVTHRDYCSSVHIITGHKRAGKDYDIDFEALVRTKGTLVFLMGVAALGDICSGLLAAGIDPKTPAALLIRGTTAAQQRIVATVETLEAEVQRQGAKTPAIIVIGAVCGLAEEFSWYEKQMLGGVKVLLTRPRELVSETAGKLREYGAEVLELPAIRTVRIADNQPLSQALDVLGTYQWIVFTSPIGVRVFFEELKAQKKDVRQLGSSRIAAIGSGTAKELEKHGLYADLMPEVFDGEHLGLALADRCKAGERILIPRAAIGNQELITALEAAKDQEGPKKLQIDDIATYDTVYETGRLIDERAELEDGSIDYVVFTSASTVRGFAAAVGEIDYAKIRAICIGRQTQAAADALGMQTWRSKQASIDSLIAKLIEVHQEQRTK
jgi:uroporphyrinogen III methyltransferase/synthase